MAAIGNSYLTLLDFAKLTDPSGNLALVVEQMNRVTSILEDAYMIEGNLDKGHETTLRTGLPTPSWRIINQGTIRSKSSSKKMAVASATLEAVSAVDSLLVDSQKNGQAIRMSEASPFLMSMGLTLANQCIYGDVRRNPDRFTGLAAYYAQLNAAYQANPDALVNPSLTLPDSGRNVFDCSEGGKYGTPGNGTNTSMWLTVWGPNSSHLFFPKGAKAGIVQEDMGKVPLDDGRGIGAIMFQYVELFRASMGLCVRDWRQNVRLANIDTTALMTAGGDQDNCAQLVSQSINAMNFVHDINDGKAVWYCNRLVKTALEKKATYQHNAVLNSAIEDGVLVTRLMGIPIHRCDALMNTEAAVS